MTVASVQPGKASGVKRDRIGIAGGDQPHLARNFLVAVVGAAGLFHGALGDRQQRLIRPLHVDFVGIRIRRCDDRRRRGPG